jgi:hypothetical protein
VIKAYASDCAATRELKGIREMEEEENRINNKMK